MTQDAQGCGDGSASPTVKQAQASQAGFLLRGPQCVGPQGSYAGAGASLNLTDPSTLGAPNAQLSDSDLA